MKILALVPPDKFGQKPARYSFLAEELAAMARREMQVHTVSPYIATIHECDGVTIHPIARTRSVPDTLRSMTWLAEAPADDTFLRRLKLARTLQTISNVLNREQIDVVYSPFACPHGTAGLPAAKKLGVPVVVSLRGVDVLIESSVGYGRLLDPAARQAMAATLQAVQHVIGVSGALVNRGIELGADPDEVSVVLKGVDEKRFHDGNAAAARQQLRLQLRPTVLFVGNLIPRKGLNCLIEAVRLVRETRSDVQLVVCGDGPESQKIQIAVKTAGLEDHVIFAGRVDRRTIPEYFRACDLFVLPSLTEGSGNVLVEASATARPVIGTNVAGIPDYIDDGVTGFLFQKNDPADLAKKIILLLSDPELARRMGRAGRERVERRHRYDQMIEQLVGIFGQVVEEQSNRSVFGTRAVLRSAGGRV